MINAGQTPTSLNQISLEQIVQQIQLLNQKIDQLQNHQSTPLNGNGSTNLKMEHLDAIKINPENRIDTNGSVKHEKPFDITRINGKHFLNLLSRKKIHHNGK